MTRISRRLFHSSRIVRGALTSKPYAFIARPWELRSTLAIDTLNALGSNVLIQSRGAEVLRIQPRTNDDINEEWIDDRTRFAVDGLKRQRLTKPLVRDFTNASTWDSKITDWREALEKVSNMLLSIKEQNSDKKLRVRAICSSTTDLYSILSLCDLFESLSGDNVSKSQVECLSSKPFLNTDLPSNFRFNSTINGLEQCDLCVLVSTNLNVDAPLLSTRLRKSFLRDDVAVYQIGFRNELSFPTEQLSLSPNFLKLIANEKTPFCETLAGAKKPLFVIDSSVFGRSDSSEIVSNLKKIFDNNKYSFRQTNSETGAKSWDGVCSFHRNANDVGVLELSRTKPFEFNKEVTEKTDLLYLMNVSAEELGSEELKKLRASSNFVIVQNSHGDELTSLADAVFPGAAYTEKSGIYVNLEGRAQKSPAALTPPFLSRVDWKIHRAFSEALYNVSTSLVSSILPYSTEEEVKKRLESFVPSVKDENLSKLDNSFKDAELFKSLKVEKQEEGKGKDSSSELKVFVPMSVDFHVTNHAVSKNSNTMAKCSKEFTADHSNFARL